MYLSKNTTAKIFYLITMKQSIFIRLTIFIINKLHFDGKKNEICKLK